MSASIIRHLATTVLVVETACLLCAVRFPHALAESMIACCVVGALLGAFAYSARTTMSGFFRDLDLAGRVLILTVFALLFIAPSLGTRQWEPALGGLTVLAGLTAILSTSVTFLLTYLATGIAHAAALPFVKGAGGDLVLLIYLSLFVGANAADHFVSRAQSLRLSEDPTTRQMLGASMRVLIVSLLSATAALLFLPEGPRVHVRGGTMATPVLVDGFRFDAELETLGNALFRVVSLMVILAAFFLLYWLHRRWRLQRKVHEEELEEEILEDYLLTWEDRRTGKSLQRQARTPRGKIVVALERLFHEAEKIGYPRDERTTVKEYLSNLREQKALSGGTADALLTEFTFARYASVSLKNEDVWRFSKLVENAIAEVRRWANSSNS